MTHCTIRTITLSALIFLLVTPVVAQQSRVTVSKEDCKRLVRHHPAADVEYKPGVDVRGKAVAPADLQGSRPLKLPDSYEFDITFRVFERLGIEVPTGLGESELKVGTVSVDKRGNVSFQRRTAGRRPRSGDRRGLPRTDEAKLASILPIDFPVDRCSIAFRRPFAYIRSQSKAAGENFLVPVS